MVSPNNARATLGTVIADLKNDPQKWTVSLQSPARGGQVDAVRGMLELLWHGQSHRHGTPDPVAPLSVTKEQAEAAVHLAIAIVNFLSAGAIVRTA